MREAVDGLVVRNGEATVVEACTALLDGAPPEQWAEIAVGLSVHGTSVAQLRSEGYDGGYWWRSWGARGLLYVWLPGAAAAVVRGLDDEHWRPAEMCLKVSAARDLAEAADRAVGLAGHELPRVRAAAVRLLGRAGDTEHVTAVRSALEDPDSQVRRAAGLALERMVVRLDLPGEHLP